MPAPTAVNRLAAAVERSNTLAEQRHVDDLAMIEALDRHAAAMKAHLTLLYKWDAAGLPRPRMELAR